MCVHMCDGERRRVTRARGKYLMRREGVHSIDYTCESPKSIFDLHFFMKNNLEPEICSFSLREVKNDDVNAKI